MLHSKPKLIVIVGPTGIGKTKTAIEVAKHFKTEIISSDSRQIFKELKIGTAPPSSDELAEVKHYMVGTHSIHDYYSAWEFEQDALKICSDIFNKNKYAVLTGGSMMYVNAVINGIDDLPTIDETLRNDLKLEYDQNGIESLRNRLKLLDPKFYEQVDLKNHKRIIHALEICIMTGKPYSELRTGKVKERPFDIIKIGLNLPRPELFERINLRVDKMVDSGLIQEAKEMYKYNELNSLNTVGYKELFAHFDGEYDCEKGIELIKRNTRRYAKKQLTWFKKYENIKWFTPNEINKVIDYINMHE